MNTSRRQLALGSALAGLVTLGGFGLANAQSNDAASADVVSAAVAQVDTDTETDTMTDDTTVDTDRPERGDRPERTEELLTGEIADQVTAAALAAVPGGTVERVETDDDGAVYEAHMTDADGDRVTVTFDADVNVVEIQEGRSGGRHGRGAGGCNDGAEAGADDDTVVEDTESETEAIPETTPDTTPVDSSEL